MNSSFTIRYTGRYCSTADKPIKLQWHNHKCPEIVFITRGKNRTLFPHGIAFQCEPGCMLITPAEIMHRQIDEPCCELFYAGFEADSQDFDLSLRIMDLKNETYFEEWMKQIHTLMTVEQEPDVASELLQVLLLKLRKLDSNRNFMEQNHPALNKTIAFLKDHFLEPIGVNDMAKAAGLSTSRLNFLFQREFNCSILQFLIRKRMEHARILLMDPMKTITEVALLSGYSDMNYFVRAFRKVHGVTPMKYRRMQKNNPYHSNLV